VRNRPGIRSTVFTLVAGIYAGVAWFASAGALDQWARISTRAQAIETCAQLALGVLSVGAAISPFLRLSSGHRIRVIWGVWFAGVAGFSGLIWGPPMPLVALLFAVSAAGLAWALDRIIHLVTPH
jgi:hypothetical protein